MNSPIIRCVWKSLLKWSSWQLSKQTIIIIKKILRIMFTLWYYIINCQKEGKQLQFICALYCVFRRKIDYKKKCFFVSWLGYGNHLDIFIFLNRFLSSIFNFWLIQTANVDTFFVHSKKNSVYEASMTIEKVLFGHLPVRKKKKVVRIENETWMIKDYYQLKLSG